MKTEEIQARLEKGYTMAIYGTRENIHEQMTNDIKTLLEAINYNSCCTELKDKEILNFEVWLKKEKITEVKEVYYKCCGIDLSKELVDKAFKNRNL
jgi:hypothetical protein